LICETMVQCVICETTARFAAPLLSRENGIAANARHQSRSALGN
jgi:hypothetical protein